MSTDQKSNDKIIIRLWPKTPVLYPMAILALFCGIVSQIFGVPDELRNPGTTPASLPVETQVSEEGTMPRQDEDTDAISGKLFPDPDTTPETPDTSVDQSTPVPDPGDKTDAPADPGGVESATETINSPMSAGSLHSEKSQSGLANTIVALLFLFMLAFSLFVVCIDFEVRWSLLMLVGFLLIVMGLLMADILGYITLPSAISILDNFTLYATPLFYYCVFATWVLLMIVSSIIARLHYVKIESNEVIAVGGILESQKRMSTFRMHYTKEIQDVFEYYLPFVRSGRLIFTFPNEEQPLIMDNVININRVLKQLDKTSSAFQVKESE